MFFAKSLVGICLILGGSFMSFQGQSGVSVDQEVAESLRGRGCNGMSSVAKCDDEVEIQGNAFYCPGQILYNLNAQEGDAQKLFGAVCYLPGMQQTVDTNCGIWTKEKENCNGSKVPVWQPVRVEIGPSP